MFTKLQGRVASDPMAVPVPASMSTGRQNDFAEVLQRVVEPRRQPAERSQPKAKEQPAPPSEPQQGPRPSRAKREAEAAGEVLPNELPSQAAAAQAQPTELAPEEDWGAPVESKDPATITAPRGQATAGSATPTEGPTAATPPAAGQVLVAAEPALPTANPAKNGAEAQVRGVEGGQPGKHNNLRTAAAAAGYRTNNAAAAQRLEQARESVFQQILLKLHDGGGEMRMRLDPPELGELDLRLVLTEGNRLSLSIAAERQDLAQLLQRHLDQLRYSLQQAGLQVDDAQVQHREQGQRSAQHDEFGNAATNDNMVATNTIQTIPSGGYLRADGLDFWV